MHELNLELRSSRKRAYSNSGNQHFYYYLKKVLHYGFVLTIRSYSEQQTHLEDWQNDQGNTNAQDDTDNSCREHG